jgi:hypothetical protein
MDGLTLLQEARVAGLTVTADGGRLHIRDPRRAEPVARGLIACKAQVMRTLVADKPPPASSIDLGDLPLDWREWFLERLAIMAEQCDVPTPSNFRVIALADTLAAMRRAGAWPTKHRRF